MANNDIEVGIGADPSDLEVGLKSATQKLNGFERIANSILNNIGKNTQGLMLTLNNFNGTFNLVHSSISSIIGTIQNLVKGFIAFGDAMDKASLRTGISVESLSGLKFAAEQCGGSFESLIDSIRHFSNIIGSASMGDVASIEKLSKIGVNADLFKGLNTDTQFKMIADHIASLKDPAEQARVAMELFGKAGYKLLPMLQQGSAGINDLTQQARDMGVIVGSDTTSAAANLGDSLNVLHSTFSNFKNSIIGIFVPAINGIVNLSNAFLSLILALKPFIAALGTVLAMVGAITYGIPAIIFGFQALTIAIANAGGAAVVFNGALTALNINPVILTITLLTSAVYFLNDALDNDIDSLERMTMKASEATKVTENQIDADAKLLNRLNELSQQESLTNSEMEESKLILSQLEDGFGTWGIKLDETTGKLTGVTDGMKKFREEALKVQKQRKQAELKAVENELAGVENEIDRSTNWARFDSNWTSVSGLIGIDPNDTQYVKDLRAKKGLLEAQKAQLELDLKATQYASGNANTEQKQGLAALTSQNQAARKNKEQEEQKKITDANKNAQSMAQTVADAKLTDYDLKIKKIDEQRQKALNDLEIVRKDAVNKGDKDKIEWVDNQKQEIDAWARTQKNKVNVDFLETQQKERQQAEQKAQAEAQRRAELMAKGADTTNPDVKKAQNKVNELQETINDKYVNGEKSGKDNRSIDTLKKELQKAQAELAKTVADVSGKARVEARDERDKELAKYNKMKVDENVTNEELQKQWAIVEQAERKYKEQDREYNSAVGTIQAAQEERANNQISAAKQQIDSATTQGTFSAWETGSIGNSTAKEQLITMKKMLDELIGINKNTEEGAVTA